MIVSGPGVCGLPPSHCIGRLSLVVNCCTDIVLCEGACTDVTPCVAPCTAIVLYVFACTDIVPYVPLVFQSVVAPLDVESGHYTFPSISALPRLPIAPAPVVSDWADLTVHEQEWLALTQAVEWEHSDVRFFLTPVQMESRFVRNRLEKMMALN